MDELQMKRKQISEPESEILRLKSKQSLTDSEREELQQLEAFETNLTAALDIEVPDQLAEKILLNTDMNKPSKKPLVMQRFFAMAASIGVMSFLALRLILFTPSSTLADDALVHLYHDIEHLSESQMDANNRMLRAMKAVGISHDIQLQDLSYAANCHVGKRPGVHLVININSHAYTVLILPSVEVKKDESFSDDNFHGQIVSIEDGGLIVIGMKGSELNSVVDMLKVKFDNYKAS